MDPKEMVIAAETLMPWTPPRSKNTAKINLRRNKNGKVLYVANFSGAAYQENPDFCVRKNLRCPLVDCSAPSATAKPHPIKVFHNDQNKAH